MLMPRMESDQPWPGRACGSLAAVIGSEMSTYQGDAMRLFLRRGSVTGGIGTGKHLEAENEANTVKELPGELKTQEIQQSAATWYLDHDTNQKI